MKKKKLTELRQHLTTLSANEEHQLKGGYGRILGTRVNSRTSRWDDIPFRLVRPRTGEIQKEVWTGLDKGTPFRP